MYKNYAYTLMRVVANLRCEFKEAHFPHLLPSSLFLFLPSLLPLLHSWLKFVMGLIFFGVGAGHPRIRPYVGAQLIQKLLSSKHTHGGRYTKVPHVLLCEFSCSKNCYLHMGNFYARFETTMCNLMLRKIETQHCGDKIINLQLNSYPDCYFFKLSIQTPWLRS